MHTDQEQTGYVHPPPNLWKSQMSKKGSINAIEILISVKGRTIKKQTKVFEASESMARMKTR